MPNTIPGLLIEAAERDADGIWIRTDDGALSFGQTAAAVARIGERLTQLGVRPRDLVLVTTRTTPEYLLTWLAVVSMGAILVPTDPESAAGELVGLARQVSPRVIISDVTLIPSLTVNGLAALASLGVLDVNELVGNWLEPMAGGTLMVSTPSADDLAILIPTSGTTGKSKLVMQTHRAYAMAGEGFPYWMELTSDDRLMTSLPLFHVNAPAYSMLGSLACGAGFVLLPRFSASGFLDSARRHGATEFNAIGAMLEILMRQPIRADDADTPLRLCYTGPSPAREWQEAFEERFGLKVVCGYAMSESPYGLIWRHGTRPFGTLGWPRQHPTMGEINYARVVLDDGAQASVGDVGELLLQNPTLTPGYWEMPDETAAVLVDGWLHTGDLVTTNLDGSYTFVSRKKEVIRRRGKNLSPAEVEDALLTHPGVLECAVVAVPSELTEDEVKAFIVFTPGERPSFDELRQWANSRLSEFKLPRFWEAIDDLPRTPTARIAKHRLPAGHTPDEYDSAPLHSAPLHGQSPEATSAANENEV